MYCWKGNYSWRSWLDVLLNILRYLSIYLSIYLYINIDDRYMILELILIDHDTFTFTTHVYPPPQKRMV